MSQIYTKQKRPPTRYRVFSTPSLAVPDQTMSLKTMVSKYVRGLPIAAPNLNGDYTLDEIAQDFTKLDYATQEEIILKRSEELSEIKERVTTEQQKQAAQALENTQKKDKEIEDLKKQIETLKPAN